MSSSLFFFRLVLVVVFFFSPPPPCWFWFCAFFLWRIKHFVVRARLSERGAVGHGRECWARCYTAGIAAGVESSCCCLGSCGPPPVRGCSEEYSSCCCCCCCCFLYFFGVLTDFEMGNKQSNANARGSHSFNDLEVSLLVKMYKNLAANSPGKTINKSMFLKFFPLPGLFGERLFNLFDTKRTNVIDYEEFLAGCSQVTGGTAEGKMHFFFQLYDLNDDRCITRVELEAILRHVPVEVRFLLRAYFINATPWLRICSRCCLLFFRPRALPKTSTATLPLFVGLLLHRFSMCLWALKR